MSQKELLYYEDALGHEKIIISLLDESIKNMTDSDLISFMKKEKKTHNSICKSLEEVLKEKANE